MFSLLQYAVFIVFIHIFAENAENLCMSLGQRIAHTIL